MNDLQKAPGESEGVTSNSLNKGRALATRMFTSGVNVVVCPISSHWQAPIITPRYPNFAAALALCGSSICPTRAIAAFVAFCQWAVFPQNSADFQADSVLADFSSDIPRCKHC